MDNNTVPYIVYESSQTRAERRDRRFILALIIVTTMLFVSNILWLWVWSSCDIYREEILVDTHDGVTNFIGSNGDISNDQDNLLPTKP